MSWRSRSVDSYQILDLPLPDDFYFNSPDEPSASADRYLPYRWNHVPGLVRMSWNDNSNHHIGDTIAFRKLLYRRGEWSLPCHGVLKAIGSAYSYAGCKFTCYKVEYWVGGIVFHDTVFPHLGEVGSVITREGVEEFVFPIGFPNDLMDAMANRVAMHSVYAEIMYPNGDTSWVSAYVVVSKSIM